MGWKRPKSSAARRCRWYRCKECVRCDPTALGGLGGSKRCPRICRLPTGRAWFGFQGEKREIDPLNFSGFRWFLCVLAGVFEGVKTVIIDKMTKFRKLYVKRFQNLYRSSKKTSGRPRSSFVKIWNFLENPLFYTGIRVRIPVQNNGFSQNLQNFAELYPGRL